MDRLTLRSLLSHDLLVIWTYRRRTVIHRSAFWYRRHKNTVADAVRRHLGKRQKECSEYLGERRERIGWPNLSYEKCIDHMSCFLLLKRAHGIDGSHISILRINASIRE